MSRTYTGLIATLLAISLFCWGCRPPKVDMARGQTSFEPHEYKDAFAVWSREFQILPVDGVENVLTARATYLSYEFRMAYVARVAYDLRMTPDEKRIMTADELAALDARHEFFVTVMSGVDKSDDLDPEKGLWQIRLGDDKGRQAAPLEVTKIRKPTLAEARYFDFENVQRTAYRISFPLTAEDGGPILSESTRFFDLMFSSALGQGDMHWETK